MIGGLLPLKHVYACVPTKSAAGARVKYDVDARKRVYKIICTVAKPDEFSNCHPTFEQVVQSMQFE